MLVLLLEKPTSDSVEIACGLMREVGAFLAEAAPKANNGVFERFRAILHESGVEKRVQYMIEVLFQVRREKFKDNPIIPEGLDLVEEDDIITHRISLDDELTVQDGLNVFKVDPEFNESEAKYKEMKREILGDSSDQESGSEEDDEAEDEDEDVETGINADGTVEIHDKTETNLVNLRRTIYLTIMSALDFEEAVHKLLKMQITPGQESELCNMIIECCSQERTYSKFYGLMGERLCKLNQVWSIAFEGCFRTYYDTIHRYETNRLRNIARFFGHLFATDGIPWSCMDVIRMTEEDTTSSSRIFVKIMFQEILENLGLVIMKKRFFDDPALKPFMEGLFPKDHPKNTRFSVNFFTSIGLGALTEEMREHLKVCLQHFNTSKPQADEYFSLHRHSCWLNSRLSLLQGPQTETTLHPTPIRPPPSRRAVPALPLLQSQSLMILADEAAGSAILVDEDTLQMILVMTLVEGGGSLRLPRPEGEDARLAPMTEAGAGTGEPRRRGRLTEGTTTIEAGIGEAGITIVETETGMTGATVAEVYHPDNEQPIRAHYLTTRACIVLLLLWNAIAI